MPSSGCPLIFELRRWLLLVVMLNVYFCPFLSPLPRSPFMSMVSLPSLACATNFASPSLYLLCLLQHFSAACPVESVARRWHTSPDINRTQKRDSPCGTYIARSCMSTWAHIRIRRRQQDKPIFQVTWREPPVPSPPPSLCFPPLVLIDRPVSPVWPSLSLIPSIAREGVADVTYVSRRVCR